MDTCAVETGLLKKHPCGKAAVAKCANCEMAICVKHAVRQKNGKSMCAECDRSNRTVDTSPTPKVSGAPAPKPAGAPAPAAKPAAPAAKAAAPAPAQAAAKPAEAKEEKFKLEETGPIEFTPTKKP